MTIRQLSGIALALQLAAPLAVAQTLPWLDEAKKAVARIEFVECPPALCDKLTDPKRRVGTGFLVKLGERIALLTALHVVAGQGRVNYRFTWTGDIPRTGRILAVAPDSDLALLEVVAPAGVRPLTPKHIDPCKQAVPDVVYILGHGRDTPVALDSSGRTRKLGQKLSEVVPAKYAEGLRSLGFPKLEACIVGLQGALQPGDSGAPVFAPDGNVVAVGNGGIPESNGYISWAMPTSPIGAFQDYQGSSYVAAKAAGSAAQYSSEVERMFYVDDYFAKDTPLSRPIVQFAARFDTNNEFLQPYVDVVQRLDPKFVYEPDEQAFFKAHRLRPGNRFFPGSNDAKDFRSVLDALSRVRVSIDCFTAKSFGEIVRGEKDVGRAIPLLQLGFFLGDVATQISQNQLELSLSRHFDTQLNLSTLTPRELNSFLPGVTIKVPGRLQELLGGACKVELDDVAGVSSPLEWALARGVLLLRIQVSALMAFDIWSPALIPRAGDMSRVDLWGALPPRPILARDDGNSIFKRK